ncbi:MAG: SAM-dependent methyltransferase, partial [Phycisphaerales bacterium JB058]
MAKRVLQDKYFRKAKTEGYVARSAFKLKELQQKFELIQRGGRVLDLGCSPGSWLQVAAEYVGRKGLLVGVDLKPTAVILPCTCHTIV